ncbi:MAG: ABC transporter ATP-binding protein [Bacillota bacterium]|jgi:ABC-2 type transport system ATP-binding protein|nr:ABC transporter ATP-binding protein [Bacillota bacterium]HHU43870.1 ABC transporter ATP-binding protein [Clostridiales bacterium]
MLEIKNLTKRYRNASVNAVEDLNLKLNEGEIFGFLGMNGAGKSTTIKCLTGIYPFDKGQITICGKDIVKDNIQAKLNIGYVPDNHSVYEKFTGKEYVNYISDLYKISVSDRKERLEKYAKMFRLSEHLDKQIKSYSHGMKQKICIIAALIHQPPLWVLDEPMMGLDPQSTVQIVRQMREHCQKGNTVFFSSHNLDMVAKICDRAAIIEKGKLHTIIDLHQKGNKETLEETFLKITAFEEDYE